MIIWRWRPGDGTTNVGDELNTYLWPRLLPAKFADIDGVFYGVGTVLNDHPPEASRYVVFGAAAGYCGAPKLDERWKVYFVRDPVTSRELGGVPWITDPGVLLHHFFPLKRDPQVACSFVPRWDSISPELLVGCEKAGIRVIDPRRSVEDVVAEIQDSKLVLTEALHGAIIADTLRVPWISIYGQRGHERKWSSWCWSLEQVWNPIDAVTFSLSWARDHAVPQLSAQSILDSRKRNLDAALGRLIADIEAGRFA